MLTGDDLTDERWSIWRGDKLHRAGWTATPMARSQMRDNPVLRRYSTARPGVGYTVWVSILDGLVRHYASDAVPASPPLHRRVSRYSSTHTMRIKIVKLARTTLSTRVLYYGTMYWLQYMTIYGFKLLSTCKEYFPNGGDYIQNYYHF